MDENENADVYSKIETKTVNRNYSVVVYEQNEKENLNFINSIPNPRLLSVLANSKKI